MATLARDRFPYPPEARIADALKYLGVIEAELQATPRDALGQIELTFRDGDAPASSPRAWHLWHMLRRAIQILADEPTPEKIARQIPLEG